MWDWLGRLQQLREEGTPAAIVTVIDGVGSTPREAGAKMIVLADGSFEGTIGGGQLEQLALADARACLARGENTRARYPLGAKAGQCCGGVSEVFIELFNHGPRLYLFGAGHVGQALCTVLDGTPFTVDLVDERPEWLDASTLPRSVRKHPLSWEEFVDKASWEETRTYVAVMTHRHDVDEAIIRDVVHRRAAFIGLIGSETKWRRFRYRLGGQGIPAEALDRVQCPIGLVTGKAPKEIAIGIASELLRRHHQQARAASESPRVVSLAARAKTPAGE